MTIHLIAIKFENDLPKFSLQMVSYYPRALEPTIQKALSIDRSKVIIVVGQRQTGKTSLLRHLAAGVHHCFIDLEDILQRELLTPSVDRLTHFLTSQGNPEWLLLDEIQCLPRAGSVLKLLHDHFPTLKIVATGSASFLLLKNIGDSLYGRHKTFFMHPFSVREILQKAQDATFCLGVERYLAHKPQLLAWLDDLLIYGSLPEVWQTSDRTNKRELLKSYVNSLLFKDVFEIEGIRNPHAFIRLLKLLALQLGSEVNPNELAGTMGIDRKTVLEYIHLYEKFCILHSLPAFSANPRKEISKGVKIYFTDLGIRNAMIDNYIAAPNRTDTGHLFENVVINQIKMQIDYFRLPYKMYFWRSYSQSEIDLLLVGTETEEIIPIEIKWRQHIAPPKTFLETYTARIKQWFCVTRDNFDQFV